jgi:signal transduction histidine kinase
VTVASRPSPLARSLVARTVLLVGGVVLLLGAAVVLWITAEDRREAVAESVRREAVAEREMHALAEELVRDHQDIAVALVEGVAGRTREWLEEEPLGLYRDRAHPDRVDVDALRRALTAELRARSRSENEHVRIVADRLGREAKTRVERVASRLHAAEEARAEVVTADRRTRLAGRMALLLAGLAALLAVALWTSVIAPVRRLRAAVDRIAAGDLATPVTADAGRADELGALAREVDGMRRELLRAREGLEAEVARKTRDLARTLAERTAALEELVATRDRLVQAAKMASLGTLAGGLAHEFNNLLGGIAGCAESAAAENRDPSVAEDLAMIRRTADRGTKLVRGMLDVAKPGTRAFEDVDLAALVDDAVRTVAPLAERRRVAIRREGGGVPPIRGDAAQLHQVTLNLLTNALQAVDDEETVVVALRPAGGSVVLEVRDSGGGVPAELRPRIFEPFFSGREGGTGLGLFVSYGIVERHGGRIEVGDAPEGGASFRVTLPKAPPEPESGAREPSGPSVASGNMWASPPSPSAPPKPERS